MRRFALIITLAACTSAPSTTSIELALSVDRAQEAELLALTNQSRAEAGLSPLLPYWDLVDDARAHADTMRRAGEIHHNDALTGVTRASWSLLGENVGVGPSARLLHPAFMASPGHRANVLGDYDYVGIGALRDDAGSLWVVVVFMASEQLGLERGMAPFHDDDGNPHEPNIAAIAEAGITRGCNPPFNDEFCPNVELSRAEMAVFLDRALSLPRGSNAFDDDDAHWAEASIDAIAAAGITLGCAERRFCPDATVTRAEMAAFLVRALRLPTAPSNEFDDDEGHWSEANINALAAAGITAGCAPGRFCPEHPVTRAQMASFLARALRLND